MAICDNNPIVTDENLFSESYVPGALPGREGQADELWGCLCPVLEGRRPIHTWLYGKPGTGKTATVLHVLRKLGATAASRSLTVNCWEHNTLFEVVDDAVSQLRILRAEEHRTTAKLDRIRRFLGDRPFVIVLECIDRITPSERTKVVHVFSQFANVGLVCTSMSLASLYDLEDHVRSRLSAYPMRFPAYLPQELETILRWRAEGGLREQTWTKQDLEGIAQAAAGDARAAIQALRNAAELAKAAGKGRLDLTGLQVQWDRLREARERHALQNLTQDHRIMCAVVSERGQVSSTDLYREYVKRCASLGRKPVALRTSCNYTRKLVQIGRIGVEQARVKGREKLFKAVPGASPGLQLPQLMAPRTDESEVAI